MARAFLAGLMAGVVGGAASGFIVSEIRCGGYSRSCATKAVAMRIEVEELRAKFDQLSKAITLNSIVPARTSVDQVQSQQVSEELVQTRLDSLEESVNKLLANVDALGHAGRPVMVGKQDTVRIRDAIQKVMSNDRSKGYWNEQLPDDFLALTPFQVAQRLGWPDGQSSEGDANEVLVWQYLDDSSGRKLVMKFGCGMLSQMKVAEITESDRKNRRR